MSECVREIMRVCLEMHSEGKINMSDRSSRPLILEECVARDIRNSKNEHPSINYIGYIACYAEDWLFVYKERTIAKMQDNVASRVDLLFG